MRLEFSPHIKPFLLLFSPPFYVPTTTLSRGTTTWRRLQAGRPSVARSAPNKSLHTPSSLPPQPLHGSCSTTMVCWSRACSRSSIASYLTGWSIILRRTKNRESSGGQGSGKFVEVEQNPEKKIRAKCPGHTTYYLRVGGATEKGLYVYIFIGGENRTLSI